MTPEERSYYLDSNNLGAFYKFTKNNIGQRSWNPPLTDGIIEFFNGVILHRMCNFKIKLCKIKTGNV